MRWETRQARNLARAAERTGGCAFLSMMRDTREHLVEKIVELERELERTEQIDARPSDPSDPSDLAKPSAGTLDV